MEFSPNTNMKSPERLDLLVGRVRGVYLGQNVGFLTHNYTNHYAFYFSGFREVSNIEGVVSFSKKRRFYIPEEGEYVLFQKSSIAPPLKQGQSPRVEVWTTAKEYYQALSDKYVKVFSENGEILFNGGINSLRKFVQGCSEPDELIIQIT